MDSDPRILVALIGAAGAIIAAIVGGLIGRSELWDRLFSGGPFPRLAGTRWESKWTDPETEVEFTEIMEFTKQKRDRIYGNITVHDSPELKWQIEGDYNGRFLRLFCHPSPDAQNKFFMDSACYFFEREGKGTFHGYLVGFDLDINKIEITEHQLRPLAS